MLGRLDIYGEWLRSDPAGFVLYIVYLIITVLLSLILHECAHGLVALKCGDPTAKMMGRLTLDPRKHLDPFGTICMLFLGFGWARPVPVDPRNFRQPRRDEFLVSIAGITVNLTLFIACTAISVLVNRIMVGGDFYAAYNGSVAEREYLYNAMSDIVFVGAVPEDLAGLMAVPALQYLQRFLVMMRQINLSLAVFNLLPIPPLDGFRLLNNLLRGRIRLTRNVFQVMQAALLILCLSGALGKVLSVVTGALDSAVTHVFLLV